MHQTVLASKLELLIRTLMILDQDQVLQERSDTTAGQKVSMYLISLCLLLAGTEIEPASELSYKQRQGYSDMILQDLLGPASAIQGLKSKEGKGRGKAGSLQSSVESPARLMGREDVGTYVHTFSHIRQVSAPICLTTFVTKLMAVMPPSSHNATR